MTDILTHARTHVSTITPHRCSVSVWRIKYTISWAWVIQFHCGFNWYPNILIWLGLHKKRHSLEVNTCIQYIFTSLLITYLKVLDVHWAVDGNSANIFARNPAKSACDGNTVDIVVAFLMVGWRSIMHMHIRRWEQMHEHMYMHVSTHILCMKHDHGALLSQTNQSNVSLNSCTFWACLSLLPTLWKTCWINVIHFAGPFRRNSQLYRCDRPHIGEWVRVS